MAPVRWIMLLYFKHNVLLAVLKSWLSPKLFQRFYRAEHQNKNGAGIGLAIVKEIIQCHHGAITAENGREGLKMSISMPMLDRNLTNS